MVSLAQKESGDWGATVNHDLSKDKKKITLPKPVKLINEHINHWRLKQVAFAGQETDKLLI